MTENKNSKFKTEQEAFWAGEFGNDYAQRNQSAKLHAGNVALFSKIMTRTQGVKTVIEFGANIGMNIRALKPLLPDAKFTAVEINDKAITELKKLDGVEAIHASVLDFQPKSRYDFCLFKGVLIHLSPDVLPGTYEMVHKASARYVCFVEYYNPTPVQAGYHGNQEKLFKRDFAGEFLEKFPDMKLIDYGFVYRNDPVFQLDDVTWFLMERRT